MIVLGLDISTKTGYAVLSDQGLLSKGLVKLEVDSRDKSLHGCVEDYGFLSDAHNVSQNVMKIIPADVDFIYIEQTNQGRNRTNQKQLEFIHCLVLDYLEKQGLKHKVRYVNTSTWRSVLKIRMTKDDSKRNKLVKDGELKGKITTKHLAVRWVNENYNLKLLLKDNDIADAIAVASFGIIYESRSVPSITEIEIEKLFK